MLKNYLKNKKAFNLVEVVVAITIIIILVGISYLYHRDDLRDSRDFARKNDIKTIANLLEENIYFGKDLSEPSVGEVALEIKSYQTGKGDEITGKEGVFGAENLLNFSVLTNLPVDPKDKNKKYKFWLSDDKKYYRLETELEKGDNKIFYITNLEEKRVEDVAFNQTCPTGEFFDNQVNRCLKTTRTCFENGGVGSQTYSNGVWSSCVVNDCENGKIRGSDGTCQEKTCVLDAGEETCIFDAFGNKKVTSCKASHNLNTSANRCEPKTCQVNASQNEKTCTINENGEKVVTSCVDGYHVNESGVCEISCRNPIFLDSNGVTIKADDCAVAGQTYRFNNLDYYIARDKQDIKQKIASGFIANRIVTTKVTNMRGLFNEKEDGVSKVEPIIPNFNQDIGNWDVSNVIDMYSMFYNASNFNRPLNNWNVSNVTDISNMFYGASKFNQDIGNWNVSNVSLMGEMFRGASEFDKSLNNWNVSNVTDMGYMFYGASKFNKPLNNWNVSKVTKMFAMFYRASKFNQNIGNWDVSKVKDMRLMFYHASEFNQNIGNWNVSNVTNMSQMFSGASKFNQNIGNWNVSKVTDMSSMFYGVSEFNQNIGNWNVSNVTDMSAMFFGLSKFNQNIGNWDVSKVTDMSFMFYGASEFNQNIGNWNVSNVTNMSHMFNRASKFNGDIGNWNVLKVTGMSGILANAQIFNKNLENWRINPNADVKVAFSLANEFKANQNYCEWPNWSHLRGKMELMGLNRCNFTVDGGVGTYSDDGNLIITCNSETHTKFGNECRKKVRECRVTNGTGEQRLRSDGLYGPCVPVNCNNGFTKHGNVCKQNVVSCSITNGTGNKTLQSNGEYGSCLVASCHNGYEANLNNTACVLACSPISRDSNGVTIKASSCATAGQTYRFENVDYYIARDKNDIKQKIASGFPANRIVTTKVTDISELFKDNTNFNQDIGNWDVSNVTNMFFLFKNARTFNKSLNFWNVSNVTDMRATFEDATAFNGDISNWNTANVTNMSWMFKRATSFNSNIGNWNVSKVTSMMGMFEEARTFNRNINSWNTEKLTNLEGTFKNARAFNSPLNNWNVSKVTVMKSTFENAIAFNQELNSWNVSSVNTMELMFKGASVFNKSLNNWNTSNVRNMSTMFREARKFNGNISSWNTANVTNMSFLFNKANDFNQNIGNWNIGRVTNMHAMFEDAVNFNQNIGTWNTTNVTDMAWMFNRASNFNQDISNWCVANIQSKPASFDNQTNSNFRNNTQKQPQWGTCKQLYTEPIPTTCNRDAGTRFKVNGETIKDNYTGLFWETNPSTETKTWEQAKSHCAGLTKGGFSDWRLPDRSELISIVNYSCNNPATYNGFNLSSSNDYWSSTTYAYNTYHAWPIYFHSGYGRNGRSKDYYSFLSICVR